MSKFPKRIPVIEVRQPLGTFYVASISARDLLKLTFSVPAKMESGPSSLSGTQRLEKPTRLREIADYIETQEAAFPNSIIIGANYDENGRSEIDVETTNDENGEERTAWYVVSGADGRHELVIPTDRRLGSIIDGQHRLHAFKHCEQDRKDMELLCSIYIDLPIPYHAFLFSTINFNQKKVDRSLAYNLFGFDIESTDPRTWVPETAAVSIARQLNFEPTPFKDRIFLGLASNQKFNHWKVSMATVVDGILKLISKKPKDDRHALLSLEEEERKRSILNDDASPLRVLYLGGYDEAIKEIVCSYFDVVERFVWRRSNSDSYIFKTVGIQALFDVLVFLMKDFRTNHRGDLAFFEERLFNLNSINENEFAGAQASGIGRTFIRNKILEQISE